MNSSNGSEIYFSKDYWFSQFGSTMLLDLLQLLAVLPFSLIGAVFNFLSYYTLSKRTFRNSVFYNYLRVYTLNSLLVNVVMAFVFWPSTLRTFEFSNTYAAAFYKAIIYPPLINGSVLFGSLMDILISLERLFKFFPHLEAKFTKIPKWKLISMLLFVTVLLCVQYLFKFIPAYIDVQPSASTAFRIYFIAATPFTDSLWGKVINYLVYFIRDVLCLLAETGLNIYVSVLISQQIKLKKKLTNAANSHMQSLSRSEQKATQMVIIMCSFSTLEHIVFFVMAVNFDFNMNYEAFLLGVAANVCITLKHSSNFLLFYYFNGPFRKAFKRQLRFTKKEVLSDQHTHRDKNESNRRS